MNDDTDTHTTLSRRNRRKKLEGRTRKRGVVQGTRAYIHAMTNSKVKRAAEATTEPDEKERHPG